MKRSFVMFFFLRGAAAVGSLIFTVIVAQHYTPDKVASTFLTIVYLYSFSMIAKGGMDVVALRAKFEGQSGKLILNILLTSLLFVFLSLFLVFMFFLVSGRKEVFPVAMMILPFSLNFILSSLFRSVGKVFQSSVLEPGYTFLFSALVIAAYSDYIEPILCITFGFYLQFLYGIYRSSALFRFKRSYVSPFFIKKLVGKGRSFIGISLLSYLTMWLPALIVESSLSQQDFVDYTLAMRMLAPVAFVIITIDYFISKYVRDDEFLRSDGFVILVNKSRFVSSLAVVCVVFIAYLIFEFDLVVLAELSDTVFYLFLVFSVGYLVQSLVGPMGVCLNMTGNERYVAIASYIQFLTVLFLSIFIGNLGLYFSAMTISFSLAAKSIYQLYGFRKIGVSI